MMLDVFNHFMPKTILDRMATLVPGHIALKAFPQLPTLWDTSARLRLMEGFGDYQQVLSLSNPPIEMLGGPDLAPELARIANDGLAELCQKHADRFPCFIASMPMNNVDACLAEIDRIWDLFQYDLAKTNFYYLHTLLPLPWFETLGLPDAR